MRNNQQGFTLIELIVVIVILGILGAVAIPKFLDLRADAVAANAAGIAGRAGPGNSDREISDSFAQPKARKGHEMEQAHGKKETAEPLGHV